MDAFPKDRQVAQSYDYHLGRGNRDHIEVKRTQCKHNVGFKTSTCGRAKITLHINLILHGTIKNESALRHRCFDGVLPFFAGIPLFRVGVVSSREYPAKNIIATECCLILFHGIVVSYRTRDGHMVQWPGDS